MHINVNCLFVDIVNDKERFMSKTMKLYVCIVAIQILFVRDELLVDYSFYRSMHIQKQSQVVDLPSEVPTEHKEATK